MWSWSMESSGCFSSSSAYRLLFLKCASDESLVDREDNVFKNFWKSKAPRKILVFGWQVLLDRLPTKTNPFRRNVLGGNQELTCVFFNEGVEDDAHLFLHCHCSSQVLVKAWLGQHVVLPSSLLQCYSQHGGLFPSKKVDRKGT